MATRGGSAGAEQVIADSARVRAQRELDTAGRRGGRLALRCRRIADRAAGLRDRAVAVVDRFVTGPAGVEDAALVRERHDRGAAEIDRASNAGETRHRLPSRGARVVARCVPWVDALLFAYFISGVVNVDLTAPWTTGIASLVALAFTLFLVLTVAAFTPRLGHRLRALKGPGDELAWADLDGGLRALVVLWGVLTAGIGTTMYVRVQAEAAAAGAEPWTGVAVAVLLALASVTLNAFVLVVAMAGSDLADDTRRRGRVIAGADRRAARLRTRATRLDRRRARLADRIRLREARAQVRAGQRLREGERTVELVRIGTGAASGPVPVAGELDDRAVRQRRALL